MPLPKIIPEKIFRLTGAILILIAIVVVFFWVENQSGVYGMFSRMLEDSNSVVCGRVVN